MNQINLREAPLVDKPEDGATLFALNPDGTINRIKADGIGGGGVVKMVADLSVISGDQASALSLQNLKDGVSTLASVSSIIIPATCENMTFEEACEIAKAGDKLDIVMRASSDGQCTAGYTLGFTYTPAQNENPEKIEFLTHPFYGNASIMWCWTADSITFQP